MIRALLAAGFDPRFCSLLCLERGDPSSAQSHFKLLEACSVVWSFGPAAVIEPGLRYRPAGRRAVFDLSAFGTEALDDLVVGALIKDMNASEIDRHMRLEDKQTDLFEGKTILRHESGNCAAVAYGPLVEPVKHLLYPSLGYPIVCMATKSVFVVDGEDWIAQAAELMYAPSP